MNPYKFQELRVFLLPKWAIFYTHPVEKVIQYSWDKLSTGKETLFMLCFPVLLGHVPLGRNPSISVSVLDTSWEGLDEARKIKCVVQGRAVVFRLFQKTVILPPKPVGFRLTYTQFWDIFFIRFVSICLN